MNIEPEIMAAAAGRASELLKALANPHRLMLLCQMTVRERTVGELAAALGIRESTASQHLALLRRDGLVSPRRDGQTIWYSISSHPAQQVMATLFELFCTPAPLCEGKLSPATAGE